MKFLLSMICAVFGVTVLLLTQDAAKQLGGLEKFIVEISGGVICAGLLLLFLVFSVSSMADGIDRCDECGRPTDPRLAYSEEPDTRHPACRECKRPLPDSQWNA